MSKNVKIMDVTLRDGSYANNFQFSCAQQKLITAHLERAGIPYIEIGHGMGLHASCPENGVALHSDEEYLAAAQAVLKKACYGMFCIPGVARLEDIDMAAGYGIGFIRVGTNVTEVELSEPYIRRAKQRGLLVMTNYMKSYAVPAQYFAGQVLKSEAYGADMAYVVDSAGCMMPEQLEALFQAVRERSEIALGFHGHDNLGMVMSNSFKAVELGFELVDCSLQGMGRSAGNTPTELFAACLQKRGYTTGVDVHELLKAGKKYVFPLAGKHNIIDTMCGITGLHTAYLGAIHRVAGKYGVNPLVLMEKYTAYDQVHMDVEKLDEMARSLPEDLDGFMTADFSGYFGHEQD